VSPWSEGSFVLQSHELERRRDAAEGRGLHSSTFQLDVSTLCGIGGVEGQFEGGGSGSV